MEEIRIGRIFILVSKSYKSAGEDRTLPRVQLSCFSGPDSANNEWWPYGSEWLPCKDWHSTSSYLPMQTGEVANWIINKVTQIIEEIESRDLPM